ncbi:PilZ domain-containing protein [Blastococcus sp. DSM 46786]|uniref:PilZ domain-containing protein n=1 Tax=Blastococcus sp. DSM 46786 TaxID=1798227 RepID=UPI0008D100BA|nr:PilZ domain-containing protein [Blastococcus sp. DSM 46786]SEL28321.1 PilZ domain-containing protein [Blastococcus sp. DSM 46786]
MSSVPGVDHPAEQTEVEVRLSGTDVAISARVEVVHEGVVSVRPSASEFVEGSVVKPGDAVEVYWRSDAGHRLLPAEVLDVQGGAVARWRLTATGPAEHSQRRAAVRGRVVVPVEGGLGAVELKGETLDVSEAGMRVHFEGFGMLPDVGTTMALTVRFEDGPLTCRGEIIRVQARGARWIMSIRFLDVQERDQDRVRRRVFQALREERARLAE